MVVFIVINYKSKNSMPSIGQIYNYYTHHIGEYQRLIERERAMVNPAAVVSVDEFLENVLFPAISRNLRFGMLLEPHKGRIEATLYYWAGLENVISFALKPDMMSEDALEIMERRRVAREKKVEKKKNRTEILQDILKQVKRENNDEGGSPSSFFISRCYPALYLGTVITAIDRVVEQPNFLVNVESSSLLSGDGKGILDFWQGVNKLKDYGGFFPHKQPYRGNRPDDDSGTVKVGGYKPAFEL